MKKLSLIIFLILLQLCFSTVIPAPTAAAAANPTSVRQTIYIGVLVKRSRAICKQRWQPLADYLSSNCYGKRFQIIPLPFAEIEAAVAEQRVDFVLVNPAIYIDLEVTYKTSRILTLIEKEGGRFASEFGGVLFYRADRGPFHKLEETQNHSFSAASDDSFGGWLALKYELQEKGMLSKIGYNRVRFTGSQDQVVYDVLAGKSDFGVVRTGILEKMEFEGRIDMKKLKVIHDHGGGKNHLPFLHSTRAYPEWPFAKLKHTNRYLADRVAMALLGLKSVDNAAIAADIGGFTTPLSYQPVRKLLRALKHRPYEHYGEVNLKQIIWQYYRYLVALLILILVIFAAIIGLSIANNRVRVLQQEQKEIIKSLHRAETEAQARRYLAQELLNAVPLPAFYLDAQHNYRGCNYAFEKFSGFSSDKLRGQSGLKFKVAGNIILISAADLELINTGGLNVREFTLTDKNEDLKTYELNLSVYHDKERQPVGLIGVINDLTSHKLMARQMAQLGAVVEQTSESIVVTNPKGDIIYVNPAFEKITGYTKAEALGQNPRVLKSGRQDESYYRELWETLNRGETWRGVFVNKRKDGTLFDESAVIFPIRNNAGKIISLAAVKRDITQEKAMQVQLRTTQRLEAVGQLAAGVAHELNTPIGFVASNFESITGYIKNFVELLENYRQLTAKLAAQLPETGPQTLAELAEIEEDMQIEFILEDLDDLFSESRDGFERITSIVTKLREFSRIDQMDARESFNFNRAIETTIVVARNEYKYSAEVKLELDPGLPDVMASGGEINQVVLNLLINAAQAIKEQEREELGNITITTDSDPDWVRCRVTDDGPGIKPEHIERIFDPFFTTKPVGKGTGLGLNISHDIITKKHHGRLEVESEPGRGTTFTISLPRHNSVSKKV